MTLKNLVNEAVANEVELRRLHSLDGDLTGKAYLAACAAVPGASVKEADAIEVALSAHDGPLIAPSLRRMAKAIGDFRRSAPISRIGAYMDDVGDAALARVPATRQSLFLVAARQVVAGRPELFGKMTKPNEFAAAIAKCLSERSRLVAEIEKSWTAADVVIDGDRVSFRLSNNVVTVSANFAENLVNWSLAERDMAKAA